MYENIVLSKHTCAFSSLIPQSITAFIPVTFQACSPTFVILVVRHRVIWRETSDSRKIELWLGTIDSWMIIPSASSMINTLIFLASLKEIKWTFLLFTFCKKKKVCYLFNRKKNHLTINLINLVIFLSIDLKSFFVSITAISIFTSIRLKIIYYLEKNVSVNDW